MTATTIIKTARPFAFAGLVAASGIALAPFTVDAASRQGAARDGAANTDAYLLFRGSARRAAPMTAAAS